MPIRKFVFEINRPYHIFNRFMDRESLFNILEYCYRFIFQMYAANVGCPATNLWRRDVIKAGKTILNGENIPSKFITVQHDPLVHFLSFALVIDHFHFKVIQNIDFGIPIYMQKLKGGFAKYINLKKKRRGPLYEGPYKAIPVLSNFQSEALKYYINIKNPLDVWARDWKNRSSIDFGEALKEIQEYSFSSLPDLLGKRHSKILAPRDVLAKFYGEELIGGEGECVEFIKHYLSRKFTDLSNLFLEEGNI